MRLLKIEFRKVLPSISFKVLAGMYLVALLIIGVGVRPFLLWLKSEMAGIDMEGFGLNPAIIPFYEFPDIWQNITSMAIWVKLLLGFSLIYSITNEFSYRTIRQNVIDGLSRKEFIISKLSLAGFLSLLSTLFLFLLGLITGLMYSSDVSWSLIFKNTYFLPAFALQLFTFLVFTLFIGTLIRKSIIAMGVLIFWTLIVENITVVLVKRGNSDNTWIDYVLPVKAINQLIHIPFPKYFFEEVQEYIAWSELGMVLFYLLLFYLATVTLVLKRDL